MVATLQAGQNALLIGNVEKKKKHTKQNVLFLIVSHTCEVGTLEESRSNAGGIRSEFSRKDGTNLLNTSLNCKTNVFFIFKLCNHFSYLMCQ